MEIANAKRMKELSDENSELKKMLIEALLKNRVMKETIEKSSERGAAERSSSTSRFEEALQPTPSM